MSHRHFSMFAILLAGLQLACNSINIFDSDNSGRQSPIATSDSTMLFVEISGGIAGVNQLLQVHESGLAVFEDSTSGGKRWSIRLTRAEIEDLETLMRDNNFFDLEGDFIDEQVADAFFYEISYTRENQSNTIITDNFAAPENLQSIVDGIIRLVEMTRENGLELSLRLSNPAMSTGESVEMTLAVKNIRDTELILNFSDGQIFDFKAFQAGTILDNDPVWNWAHDMAFVQALQTLVLAPIESRSYTVNWDGRDNSGQQLAGDFVIRADLVSLPGGSTAVERLTIRE